LKVNEEFGGIEGLCAKMGVDPIKGLPSDVTSPELAKRREKYGPNTIPSTKAKPFWRLLFDAIKVFLEGFNIFKNIFWRGCLHILFCLIIKSRQLIK